MNHLFNIQKPFTLKLKYKGKNIKEVYFKSDVPRTRQQIIDTVKQSQALAIKYKVNFDFIVALKFNSGWRNDRIFSATEDPVLYDPAEHIDGSGANYNGKKRVILDDQNTFNEFVLYAIPKPKPEGGCSGNMRNNDCFFYAISKALEGDNNILVAVNTPTKLKNKLNVERTAKITMNLIPLAEKLMKCNINVFGDWDYASKGEYIRTVNLKLSNEHYTHDRKHKVKKFIGIPNRKPIAFARMDSKNDNQNIEVVTEDRQFVINYPDFQNLNREYLVMKDKYTKNSLKDNFTEFQEATKKLKELTKDFINLEMFPYCGEMAKYIYHNMSSQDGYTGAFKAG